MFGNDNIFIGDTVETQWKPFGYTKWQYTVHCIKPFLQNKITV